MKKVALFPAIACLLICASCLRGDPVPGKREPLLVTSEDLACALETAVADGPPAISAAIATREGIIWSGTAGYSDLQNRVEAHPDDLFGIGSITKTFIAIVALQLVEEGRLAITDTPQDILGDVVAGVPNADTAQLAQLLNHTSGIPSFEDDPEWIRAARGDRADPARIWRKSESLAYVTGEGHSPLFEPGEAYSYSNTNYTLIGLMIEAVTDNDVVSEIDSRIRAPLGLSSLYLEGFEPVPEDRLTRRYHYDTTGFRQNAGINAAFPRAGRGLIDASQSNLSPEWTDGGMVATARDLASFGAAVRDGRLLDPETQKFLKSWRLIAGGDYPAWVGHGVFRETRKPGVMIGHSGSVLGYTGYVGWYEGSDVVVAVLTNAGSMHVGEPVMTASRFAQSLSFSSLVQAYARHSRDIAEDQGLYADRDTCSP